MFEFFVLILQIEENSRKRGRKASEEMEVYDHLASEK